MICDFFRTSDKMTDISETKQGEVKMTINSVIRQTNPLVKRLTLSFIENMMQTLSARTNSG